MTADGGSVSTSSLLENRVSNLTPSAALVAYEACQSSRSSQVTLRLLQLSASAHDATEISDGRFPWEKTGRDCGSTCEGDDELAVAGLFFFGENVLDSGTRLQFIYI